MMTNKLYFAQHGLAVEKTLDPERPLSESGITQTKLIASQLCTAQIAISKIFHSGKLRASQTAEIFADQLKIASTTAVDYLSPDSDVLQTIKHLDINATLFIGHLPHLEKLISQLVAGDENKGILKFQNSAVVCLENHHGQHFVQWYLTPDLLVNSTTK